LKILSLEYIRQGVDSDYINFVSKKHQVTFRLKKEVGPFLVITIETLGIVEEMILDINLYLLEEWSYDPYHIISNKMMQNGSTPCIHHSNPYLEKLPNQDGWKQVLQLLQGGKNLLSKNQVLVQ
jgi:hypothetical protein